MLLLQIIYFIASSICQIALGYQVWKFVVKIFAKLKLTNSQANELPLLAAPCFVLGLLLHLSAILLLKSLGLNWLLSSLLPLLGTFTEKHLLKRVLLSIKIKPSLNFSLWFLVIFFLGLSILQSIDGIQTIWVNNYGDACFHLGIITSLTFGDNFPPGLQIFAGAPLSYPFFINLWTASIWWIYGSYYALCLIWLAQWTICWCLVFHFLRGGVNQLLPWALLFAGGTFNYIAEVMKDPSLAPAHSFLEKGYPWTPFLTTIWIPQRTTQLGLAVILSALFLFHKSKKESLHYQNKLILTALILSFSVLAHTHFFLATTLYIGCVLTFRAFNKVEFKNLVIFTLCLIPSLIFYPLIKSKDELISWQKTGWMVWNDLPNDNLLNIIYNSLAMWLNNAPVWLFCLMLLWVIAKKSQRSNLLALLLLFLFGNLVNLAYWDWDQIKFFIALYAISLSLWASLKTKLALNAQIFAVALILPGLFEASRVLQKPEDSTIYTKEEVTQAEQIIEATLPSDIILAKPDHNSPITLTGRKLYYGYEGTLWSHGVKYEERRKKMESLNELAECNDNICPDYLYWSAREKDHWKVELPPKGFVKTGLPFLYKVQN